MPIDRIPILSEDYPLFDWDDYPLSYYALGEGELVSGFQKETWNAIIDKTKEALSAAGLYWDNFYTTPETAKVKESYGALSAKMFNSVRLNMDVLTPIGWGWAKNPNMRGYVGREHFRGYSEFGVDGDLFYAEYLLEMVRRLNLTLSIMKGTANLKEMDSQAQALCQSIQNLQKAIAAQMSFSEPSFSNYVCGIRSAKAAQFSCKGKAVSKYKANVVDIPVRRIYGKKRSLSLYKAKQESPFAANLKDYSQLIFSISLAAMEIFNCFYLSSAYGMAETSSDTMLRIPKPHLLRTESNAQSTVFTAPVLMEPQRMGSTKLSLTEAKAFVVAPEVIRPWGKILSRSNHSTLFDRLRPRRFSGKHKTDTLCIATLDSAWFAPIWVDGKLYIRQAYETATKETTLEVI